MGITGLKPVIFFVRLKSTGLIVLIKVWKQLFWCSESQSQRWEYFYYFQVVSVCIKYIHPFIDLNLLNKLKLLSIVMNTPQNTLSQNQSCHLLVPGSDTSVQLNVSDTNIFIGLLQVKCRVILKPKDNVFNATNAKGIQYIWAYFMLKDLQKSHKRGMREIFTFKSN